MHITTTTTTTTTNNNNNNNNKAKLKAYRGRGSEVLHILLFGRKMSALQSEQNNLSHPRESNEGHPEYKAGRAVTLPVDVISMLSTDSGAD
jgi:hypothetical protein